ncbi:Aste57867_16475 [Aphanomyces stellatus]|uniref:Aste57867_16475 protein n=1 Tax=Aphanomyces stellatus TaxID=120398 RepID=A0A485L7F6_9STRA|nr:hypothetical protein As57867_016418 [Aphanomyces stellatus]VFT93249.1 Aste57867_16475 [Aphanomyces stellatus]
MNGAPPAWMSRPTCVLPIAYTVEYGTMCVLSAAVIVYLRKQRTTALRGNARAARKVVLPSFEPLLWVFGAHSLAFFLFFLLAMVLDWDIWTHSVAREAIYQGQQFGVVFLGVFLLQKSVSAPAIIRAVATTAVIAAVPILLTALLNACFPTPDQLPTARHVMSLVVLASLSLFFAHMAVWPMDRASPRAVREFTAFALFYFGVTMVARELVFQHHESGVYLSIAACMWMSLAPFFVWRLLKADTQYWRGLTPHVVALLDNDNDVGQLHPPSSSSAVPTMQEILSAKGLHVLLEMHRHDLIDFAHLDFHTKIGRGASAVVYAGTLHCNEPVAIKVYSPPEISPCTVAEFSQEAAVWAVLDHPNITSFYGMCVSPPTICLVSELCDRTLADHLRLPTSRSMPAQLCLMLDAARAIAYLHSFHPPLLHRDVKPSNFLLGYAHVVKLSDFGESRVAEPHDRARLMTVRGTVEYMAPEVIDGHQGRADYNSRADVYSLGVTLWDVLHPHTTKYPHGNKNNMHLFQLVLDGARPPLRADMPLGLQELLRDAWDASPAARPSAAQIVDRLEALLEDACIPLAQMLATHLSGHRDIPGDAIIELLVRFGHAANALEAIRVGNALVDMGLLHEVKHSAAFDKSHRYVLESTTAIGLRPSATSFVSSTRSSVSEHPSTTSTSAARGSCLCRLYAQGLKRRRRRNSLVRTFKKKRAHEDNLATAELLHNHDWRADELLNSITETA